MAVDGKKFKDTLRLGSEDWFEFPCSPCARDGKNLPAIKYCVECEVNLCSSCLTHHNKFPLMRVHQITDNLSSRIGQGPDLPTERCDRHCGKLVDVYCTIHDVVGCSTCISVEHSTCQGIRNIPDITQDLQLSREMSDLKKKLKRHLVRLDHLKQLKQNQLRMLQQEKEKLLEEIHVLRKRINEKLDEMEKIVVNEVNTKIGTQERDISKDIDVIKSEQTTLETRQKSIENVKSSKTGQFLQLKLGQAELKKYERNEQDMQKDSHALKLKVLPNKNVQSLLENKGTALGNMSEVLIPKYTKHESNVNVRLPLDRNTCWISDICLTSGGDIHLADFGNSRIKRLDQSYAVIEYLDLPSEPSTLCEVDNTRFAVTVLKQKRIQFVSRNPLTLGNSFTVGDTCRGIDYYNGQLYVCCGGWREGGEGPGRIEVYSVEGDLLRSYYQGPSWPGYVHVSERGDLFVSNEDNMSLVAIRMTDHSVSDMQINELIKPVGICRVGDSQLFIAGYGSDNILLISEDGEHQQELLTENDGIFQPWAVCFNRTQSHLVFSCDDCDSIKIFEVATLC